MHQDQAEFLTKGEFANLSDLVPRGRYRLRKESAEQGYTFFQQGFSLTARALMGSPHKILRYLYPRHPQEDTKMPKIDPFHSFKENRHHDNSKCGPGSEIPPHNKLSGTGGKPLCKDCSRLDSDGK